MTSRSPGQDPHDTDPSEAVRREIAKELHDEVGQLLTGLQMQLDLGTPDAIVRAREIAGELTQRVRHLSLGLRPAVLDDFGLVPALRAHIERYTERTGVAVDLTQADADGRFAAAVELAAFRIVQEALTNVARHSGATRASVGIALDGGTLTLRIEDEGRGTDSKLGAAAAGDTAGLSGMAERAAALGGKLTFESSPGRGTVVVATIPVAGNA